MKNNKGVPAMANSAPAEKILSGSALDLASTQSHHTFFWTLHVLIKSAPPTTSASDIAWTPSIKSGARDEIYGPIKQYCEDLSKVVRRKTRTVTCGPIKFGSEHPIVRQTMGTTEIFA